MGFIHPTTLPPPEAYRADEFFRSLSPKVLNNRKELSHSLGGSVAFRLAGANGGEWTLDFAHGSVLPGVADDATVTLEMSVQDFEGLINGKWDLSELDNAHRVVCTGRRSKFKDLALLFS